MPSSVWNRPEIASQIVQQLFPDLVGHQSEQKISQQLDTARRSIDKLLEGALAQRGRRSFVLIELAEGNYTTVGYEDFQDLTIRVKKLLDDKTRSTENQGLLQNAQTTRLRLTDAMSSVALNLAEEPRGAIQSSVIGEMVVHDDDTKITSGSDVRWLPAWESSRQDEIVPDWPMGLPKPQGVNHELLQSLADGLLKNKSQITADNMFVFLSQAVDEHFALISEFESDYHLLKVIPRLQAVIEVLIYWQQVEKAAESAKITDLKRPDSINKTLTDLILGYRPKA